MKKTVILYITACFILLTVVLIIGCHQEIQPATPSSSLTIPSAPANLEANALSPSVVEIRWLDNSNNEDGFKIYRGTTLVGTVPPNTNIFQDTGLQPGNTYQYAIRAYNQAGESQVALCSVTTPAPPSVPANLVLNAVSQTAVQLMWEDTSNNEDGFRIFRDGILISSVEANINKYNDIGLRPATHYQYSVIAFNKIGESQSCSKSIETLNPPIRIWLNGLGVYDNRESLLRGMGDVYVLIGIVDGSSSVELKFPQGQGQTYSLDKNETVSIDTIVYSSSEVADSLQIFFVGYESDGGPFEQIAYEVLGMAVDYYTAGMTTGLAEAFDINLATIIGSILGDEDDFLGQYELRCDKNNNWGIGQYTDIVLQDERGVDCLRLWFTIESQ